MRPLLFLLGVIAAIYLPPWAVLIIAVLLCLRYRAWEVIFLGLYIDFITLPEASWGVVPYATVLAFILVWGLEPLRRELLSNAGPFGPKLFR